MQLEHSLTLEDNVLDFAALLEASFAEEAPERGDIVTGTIVAIDEQGLIVGIEGMKRDGIVQRKDLERMSVDIDTYLVGADLDVMIVRMEDEDGNLVLSVSQAQQTEDWKKAEDLLREAVVLRDDFLSVASHELRTPLTALKLEVANLLRLARLDGGSERARLIAKVQKIDAQATRLRGLIDDLLDVSRLAAGQLDLDVAPVDLAGLTCEVGARYTSEAARVGSTLTVEATEAAIGHWDRDRLEQVVSNLISNAVKYGDGKPIDVTVRAEGGHAELTVRDHGLGIAPQDQERIFGRFERAASSGNYGGIGLGLWTVKQIVWVFGGVVSVESAPGAGSVFTVELPYAALAQRAAWRASTQQETIAARAAAPSSSCTVVRGARMLPSAVAEPSAAPNPNPKRWA